MKKLILYLGLLSYGALAQVPAIQFSPTVKTIDADALQPFSEGYAVVVKGASHAMIDTQGSFFIPYNKYLFGSVFNDNYWAKGSLKKFRTGFNNGRCLIIDPQSRNTAVMDRTQKLVVPFQYGALYILDNYILQFELAGSRKQHYLWDGTPIYVPQSSADTDARRPQLPRGFTFQTADIESQRLWAYENYYTGHKPLFALTDYAGRFITQPIFEEVMNFSEGLAVVMKRNEFKEEKWGVIDTNGKRVLNFMYSYPPSDFHDGLSIVIPKDNDSGFQYAYINREGELVFNVKNNPNGPKTGQRNYNWFKELFFSDGYLLLKIPKSYQDIPPLQRYDKAGNMTDLAQAAREAIKKWGLDKVFKDSFNRNYTYRLSSLDHQDGILYYSIYAPDASFDGPGFHYEGGTGMIDIANGEFSLPPIYSSLKDFDGTSGLTWAKAKVNGKEIEGYINTKGVFEMVKKTAPKW
ncbi:hypothetical protein F5984_09220 [Rudanella paleaurantiibacter]|uniref:WG repeat-containing protein n=1 Tax=Rudanella paleaurantiibacter TaxID=2614655 RepID=A0A7J5TZX9_9BACT|nr:WG repeat-containing protein [Rudanella paleaurantiibacter]KAB7731000.1 hypothetical protein F5984_09220 [Rudanella paleaurantiibacter]